MENKIIELIKDLAGNEILYFDSALVIKKTPHSIPVELWGVCVSPSNEILLMDYQQNWHKLELSDYSYGLVITTLYQRLKYIQHGNSNRLQQSQRMEW